MDFTRIYLIRHGQVRKDWQGRIYGDMDVELSEYGEKQARDVAERLREVPFSAIVSSGLKRAVYGATAVAAGRVVEPEIDPGFREMDRGEWRGLTFAELEARSPGAWAAWFAEPRDRRAPGGESLGELEARVLLALDRWATSHPAGTVAVVSHSWPIRVSATRALGLELEASVALELSTGEIAVVDWPVEGWQEAAARGSHPRLAGFSIDALPVHSGWFQKPKDSLNRP